MISILDRNRFTCIQGSVIIPKECHHIVPHHLVVDIMHLKLE